MDSAAPQLSQMQRHGLPELPSDWQWVRFSDICERVSVGHVGPTAEYFRDRADGVRFLRSQNVRPGRLDLETATAIAPEFHQKLKKSKLQGGDILFVRVGANRGDCCVVPEDLGELNCANIVFARPKHRTGFHAYFFQSELGRSLLLSASVGAAQGVINTSSVASMPVPLPPLPIQRRIASILSAYDDLIENSQRRIRILETMARALYREWFVHFRFPGHETHPRIASPLGHIPKGWEVKTIADLCESVSYGYTASATREEIGPKFLRITDIVPDLIDWAGVPFCEIPEDKAPKYLLEPGDIVVARTGATTGYAKRLNKLHPETVFASYLVRVRAGEGVSNRILGVLMESDDYKQFIKTNIGGAAQPQANAVVLTSMRLAVPPAQIAEKFDSLVAPMIDEGELLAVKIQTLRRTRDLLLPRLLSGQVNFEEN